MPVRVVREPETWSLQRWAPACAGLSHKALPGCTRRGRSHTRKMTHSISTHLARARSPWRVSPLWSGWELSSPRIEGVVLRYGHLYGPGTGADAAAEAPALHVDAAASAALLAVEKARRGI